MSPRSTDPVPSPSLPSTPPSVPAVSADGAPLPGSVANPVGLPGGAPYERRQPQVRRRPVVPVEWFRRMPGGGTTYAPIDDVEVVTGEA